MEAHEFATIRKSLNKTQKQMSELLGISIKAVHSYEQGWRTVPAHVERQVYFLISRKRGDSTHLKPCWNIKNCPPEQREICPAWEFRSGTLCWFINGTVCEGEAQVNWREKMKVCRECEVLASFLLMQGV